MGWQRSAWPWGSRGGREAPSCSCERSQGPHCWEPGSALTRTPVARGGAPRCWWPPRALPSLQAPDPRLDSACHHPTCDLPAMKALLHVLWLALACGSAHSTLSKSDAKKSASRTLLEKVRVVWDQPKG